MVKLLDSFSGLAPLLHRLILAPALTIAGYSKLGLSGDWDIWTQTVLADPNVVSWFGNTDWGLGLPFPDVLAFLVGWTEFSVIYFAMLLSLLFTGGGRFTSIDFYIKKSVV